MSCILRQRGVQLIMAYSWARPAVLAAGIGVEGVVGGDVLISSVSSLSFIFFHLPCPSLSSPQPSLLLSLSLGDDTK